MSDNLREFARIIRVARGDLTYSAFARKVGVSHTTIRAWENGERFPERENLSTLAKLTGYSLLDLQAIIEGKPIRSASDIEGMVQKIRVLPFRELVAIERAVSDRLLAIAESTGR